MSPTYIDWEFAKTAANKIISPGPSVSASEASDAVEMIRELAGQAIEPVANTSQMRAPGQAPPPFVIDRATWVNANVDSTRAMLEPVIDKMTASSSGEPSAMAQSIGSKVTGAELGGMLGFLSSKVLGQYDLAPAGTPKLLLVAPNLMEVERELKVDPRDFRLWVCMHEETHRVQFTAVPWLREHLIAQAQQLATDMAPTGDELKNRMDEIVRRVPEVFSGNSSGLVDLFASPEQRAKMADLTAVMSLLEGHADVVMDEVGPAFIPTVSHIREKFTQRRKGAGLPDRMLRRLLGLEAKMRQYRDGAVFVRAVQEKVGVEGFNAVWAKPENLPRATEITQPADWVARVHG